MSLEIFKSSICTEISLKLQLLSSVNSTKKNQAPPPKGKNQQTTPRCQQALPRGQQTTPKNSSTSAGKNSSASRSVCVVALTPVCHRGSQFMITLILSNHRSSGKKATPPTVKANMVSGSKTPSRSGTRVSARLSHEILPPNGNSKTSPGQSEPRKRPPAGNNQSGSRKHLPTAGTLPCTLLLNTSKTSSY